MNRIEAAEAFSHADAYARIMLRKGWVAKNGDITAEGLAAVERLPPVNDFAGAVRGDVQLACSYLRLKQRANEQLRHDNGAPMFSASGMLLDDKGNRSIFDDVDE